MRVRWTARAESDLSDIFLYIASDDVGAAMRILERVGEAVDSLRTFPFAGRVGRLENTRELVVSGTRYVAIYTVQQETAVVLHVLDGARRWPPQES